MPPTERTTLDMPYIFFRRAAPSAFCMAMAALSACHAALAQTQTQAWPQRPLRFVTSEPGGGADFAARVLSQGISGALGQQVIVENRVSGIVPGEVIAHAAPDGYSLLLFGGTFWLQPYMRARVPYDPVTDFATVITVATSPGILVVHPSLPVKSVRELIALARAKPGILNYAMGAPGSNNHLGAELFKSLAGVNIIGIPYKGGGPALNGLISGQVDMGFPNAASAAPHVRSGRLHALAVSSAGPSALYPELPTVASSGLPGFESGTILGVFAPARTPEPILNRLNAEIGRYLATAEAHERFIRSGSEVAGGSREQLAALVKADMTRLGKIIREAGIRAE